MGEDAVELRESRKERGAFFTPAPIARFIADWAVRSPEDTVLRDTMLLALGVLWLLCVGMAVFAR